MRMVRECYCKYSEIDYNGLNVNLNSMPIEALHLCNA
jgi:hypothetical protein